MQQLIEDGRINIMTDSLSSLTALEKVFPSKNSMENKILNILRREKLISWVPAQTGIEGNEAADEAAKDALSEDIYQGLKQQKKPKREYCRFENGENPRLKRRDR
jgi:ribonuclease HI